MNNEIEKNWYFSRCTYHTCGIIIYPIDSYISQPGGAYDLAPLVEVEGGDEDDVGTFSLMTISLSKATVANLCDFKVFKQAKNTSC